MSRVGEIFTKILGFLKGRKLNRKIYLGIAGLLLFLFGVLFPELPHYVITVEYCENKAERIGCEVVNGDLFSAFDNLLGGAVESAFEEPAPEATPES